MKQFFMTSILLNNFLFYSKWLLLFFLSIIIQLFFLNHIFNYNFLNLIAFNIPFIVFIFLVFQKQFIFTVVLMTIWGFFLDSISPFVFGLYLTSFLVALIIGWIIIKFIKPQNFISKIFFGITMLFSYYFSLIIGLGINYLFLGQELLNLSIWQIDFLIINFILNCALYFFIESMLQIIKKTKTTTKIKSLRY